jgi:cytochrome c-type biogenesis protein CcmH
MSACFWFIAGALIGVTATCVAIPLWRASFGALERRPVRYVYAAGFLVTFAAAAAVIYLAIGSRQSLDNRAAAVLPSHPTATPAPAGAPAKSMEGEVASLEARLARDGGSRNDWMLLAQAYDFLGREGDAQRARAMADTAPAVAAAATQMGTGAPVGVATAPTDRTASTAQSSVPADSSPEPPGVELQRRVRETPRDAQAWLALAGVHRRHRDYAKARDAFTKVIALNAMTAEAWADYADVMASLSGGSLTGEPTRAIDRALALDSANPKALWLKASHAHQERRFADALALWKRLRAVLPPESPDAQIVDANIAEASELAGAPQLRPAKAETPRGTSIEAAKAPEVSGTVSIDSRLAARVERDATLFIYAKAVDSPGPPLAVMRTTADAWPVSFRLDDSMAMIPSRRLSQFDKVIVEARVSRTGQAAPAPGDLYVTSAVLRPTAGKKLALVINREIG